MILGADDNAVAVTQAGKHHNLVTALLAGAHQTEPGAVVGIQHEYPLHPGAVMESTRGDGDRGFLVENDVDGDVVAR